MSMSGGNAGGSGRGGKGGGQRGSGSQRGGGGPRDDSRRNAQGRERNRPAERSFTENAPAQR
ncbi:MAG: methyltransferase, partial [Pseudarthrobacter sp.]|nr:methyltransferase [Pseudarthrobacter sp.]